MGKKPKYKTTKMLSKGFEAEYVEHLAEEINKFIACEDKLEITRRLIDVKYSGVPMKITATQADSCYHYAVITYTESNN